VALALLNSQNAAVDRSLPPVPPPKPYTPEERPLDHTGSFSPAPHPFSRQHLASPSTTTGVSQRINTLSMLSPSSFKAHSPSVLNLSQQSVVKRRLVEIERKGSDDSRASSSDASSRLTSFAGSSLRTAQTSAESSQCPSRTLDDAPPQVPYMEMTMERSVSQYSTASPVSIWSKTSVCSRPKSAFRMRDELREEQRLAEQLSPIGVLPSLNHSQQLVSATKEVNLDRGDAIGANIIAIQSRLEDVAQRGQYDSKQLEKLEKAVGVIKKTVKAQKDEMVLNNEKPRVKGDAEDKLAVLMQQVLDKLDAMGSRAGNNVRYLLSIAWHRWLTVKPFQEIMAILKDDQAQRAAQQEQQADSARYLNELNAACLSSSARILPSNSMVVAGQLREE
jgi:hypothetical protein